MGFLEFLIMWLVTIIASFTMEMANELRVFKDVADAGYKINTKRLSEFNNQINPNASKATLLSFLIPFLNIALVLNRTVQYNNIRPMILDQLYVVDALEEMNEIEKEEYLKNPTGLNSLLVDLKLDLRLQSANVVTITNDLGESKIFFEVNKSFEVGDPLKDIKILKVTGPLARMSVDEQKNAVIRVYKEILQTGINKYGNQDAFFDELIKNQKINFKTSEVQNTHNVQSEQKSSISKQKEELEKLKNDLLSEPQLDNTSNHVKRK